MALPNEHVCCRSACLRVCRVCFARAFLLGSLKETLVAFSNAPRSCHAKGPPQLQRSGAVPSRSCFSWWFRTYLSSSPIQVFLGDIQSCCISLITWAAIPCSMYSSRLVILLLLLNSLPVSPLVRLDCHSESHSIACHFFASCFRLPVRLLALLCFHAVLSYFPLNGRLLAMPGCSQLLHVALAAPCCS